MTTTAESLLLGFVRAKANTALSIAVIWEFPPQPALVAKTVLPPLVEFTVN